MTDITTAVILAAGLGSRLRPLTATAPKCLTEVAENTILGRLIDGLEESGYERLVIVTGYLGDQVARYARRRSGTLDVVCIHNPVFATTNNCYSLWCAADVLDEPFVLLEGDLVLEPEVLKLMRAEDRIAVDRFVLPMNGTTISLSGDGGIDEMQVGTGPKPSAPLYKTVNAYSFGSETWRALRKTLGRRIDAGFTNEYYEASIAQLIADREIDLKPRMLSNYFWDEIDTVDDLDRVEARLRALDADSVGSRYRAFAISKSAVAA
jgi:L-glutamine-phosphate cytidylyltransferase